MQVRYHPVPNRIAEWSVWLATQPAWLVGFVREGGGRWQARRQGHPQMKAMRGFLRRKDAAAFLLIAEGFAKRR